MRGARSRRNLLVRGLSKPISVSSDRPGVGNSARGTRTESPENASIRFRKRLKSLERPLKTSVELDAETARRVEAERVSVDWSTARRLLAAGQADAAPGVVVPLASPERAP